MRTGTMMGISVNSLYSSEVQFGYEKKNKCFLYLIDGQRYKMEQVFERTDEAGLCRSTVARRLLTTYSNTWEEILRPADKGKLKNEAQEKKRQENIAKAKRRRFLSEQAAAEKRAYFRRQKECHAEV